MESATWIFQSVSRLSKYTCLKCAICAIQIEIFENWSVDNIYFITDSNRLNVEYKVFKKCSKCVFILRVVIRKHGWLVVLSLSSNLCRPISTYCVWHFRKNWFSEYQWIDYLEPIFDNDLITFLDICRMPQLLSIFFLHCGYTHFSRYGNHLFIVRAFLSNA